jgi:hypothetical protein
MWNFKISSLLLVIMVLGSSCNKMDIRFVDSKRSTPKTSVDDDDSVNNNLAISLNVSGSGQNDPSCSYSSTSAPYTPADCDLSGSAVDSHGAFALRVSTSLENGRESSFEVELNLPSKHFFNGTPVITPTFDSEGLLTSLTVNTGGWGNNGTLAPSPLTMNQDGDALLLTGLERGSLSILANQTLSDGKMTKYTLALDLPVGHNFNSTTFVITPTIESNGEWSSLSSEIGAIAPLYVDVFSSLGDFMTFLNLIGGAPKSVVSGIIEKINTDGSSSKIIAQRSLPTGFKFSNQTFDVTPTFVGSDRVSSLNLNTGVATTQSIFAGFFPIIPGTVILEDYVSIIANLSTQNARESVAAVAENTSATGRVSTLTMVKNFPIATYANSAEVTVNATYNLSGDLSALAANSGVSTPLFNDNSVQMDDFALVAKPSMIVRSLNSNSGASFSGTASKIHESGQTSSVAFERSLASTQDFSNSTFSMSTTYKVNGDIDSLTPSIGASTPQSNFANLYPTLSNIIDYPLNGSSIVGQVDTMSLAFNKTHADGKEESFSMQINAPQGIKFSGNTVVSSTQDGSENLTDVSISQSHSPVAIFELGDNTYGFIGSGASFAGTASKTLESGQSSSVSFQRSLASTQDFSSNTFSVSTTLKANGDIDSISPIYGSSIPQITFSNFYPTLSHLLAYPLAGSSVVGQVDTMSLAFYKTHADGKAESFSMEIKAPEGIKFSGNTVINSTQDGSGNLTDISTSQSHSPVAIFELGSNTYGFMGRGASLAGASSITYTSGERATSAAQQGVLMGGFIFDNTVSISRTLAANNFIETLTINSPQNLRPDLGGKLYASDCEQSRWSYAITNILDSLNTGSAAAEIVLPQGSNPSGPNYSAVDLTYSGDSISSFVLNVPAVPYGGDEDYLGNISCATGALPN